MQDTRELEGMLPQEQTEQPTVSNVYTNTDVSTYVAPQPNIEEEPGEWTRQDIFNVYNPYFGTTYNTGLNTADTWKKTWDPENAPWVKDLSLEDKMAVSRANSEEYAQQIMSRRALYKESQSRIEADDSWAPIIAGFGAGMADPFIVAPIGVTAAATKSAYTLGAKATRLAALSAESAVVSMTAVSSALAAEAGQGLGEQEYGMTNLYTALLSGSLPFVGNMLGGGYTTAKVAKGLTSDPRNFIALTGEMTAEQLGGTQLRTAYTRFVPNFLKSDVTITASSDNKYISLISNRIDSPPMAVVDRNTGQPVAIGTTGQDYKMKFNGRQNSTISDTRGIFQESTYTDLDTFNNEVGKTIRAKAVKQEQAVYQELDDHVTFTKQQAKLAQKEELDAFVNEEIPYYKNAEGKDTILTEEDLAKTDADRVAVETYNTEMEAYNKQVDAINQEKIDYINTMLEQYKAEGKTPKELKAIKKDLIDTIDKANKDVFPLEPIVPELQFKNKVLFKKRSKSEIKTKETELELKTKADIEQAIEAKKVELYSNNQFDLVHADPAVVKAATKMEEYYAGVLEEGKRLKIHELSKLHGNKHYMTRIFDFQAIREMEMVTLVNKLIKGLKGHAANKGVSDEVIQKAATEIATQLKQLDYTRDWADYSFFVPKELGSTSFLKSKKFKLNDEMIEDLLVTNMEDVIGQYSYSQAGHFSANNAFPELQGIPREEQLDVFHETMIKPLIESGAKASEVQSLKNMFEDMLGTFRIAKDSNSAVWKGTRLMNAANSLTYGGGFAFNTAAELGGMLLDGHVSNVMKSRLGSLKEIGTMFSGKTIEDPLVRDFVLMGQLENLFETHNMMKMSDTDTVFNVNKLEHNVNKGTNEFFKWTGLRGATVALESMVGPKVIHDILDFGKKGTLSLSQQKYMARIGLNESDVKLLSNMLNKHGEFNKSGKIYDMHLDQFDDIALDKITTAVSRGMRHTVIRGDTTYLPSWMIKPNAFNRLAFQFLRYPMAATETLMARGMDESTARWMAATGTSTFMMAMVMYGREQAAIAIGATDEREAKFHNFWEDDEAAMKLFTGALSKAGTLGGSGIMLEKMSAFAGVPMPGSEYATHDVYGALLGPTFSRIPQINSILKPIFTEGTINDKSQAYALKGLMPGATVPIISEWLTTMIKENTY